MFLKRIIKLFNSGNVCVCGLRGTGKDLLMSNVVARRKRAYISNVDYHTKKEYIPLDLNAFNINNTYENFITGKINKYVYPYNDNIDIYISDCGNYFPSQFCSQLDKKYLGFSEFMSLSRHLGVCNVHYNTQNLNRVWNKMREQSDIYIMCKKTIYLFGLVIQKVIFYEKFDSAVNNVPPFKMKMPLIHSKDGNMLYKLEKEKYRISYGIIKPMLLIYFNKSKYDTRFFKKVLENGGGE